MNRNNKGRAGGRYCYLILRRRIIMDLERIALEAEKVVNYIPHKGIELGEELVKPKYVIGGKIVGALGGYGVMLGVVSLVPFDKDVLVGVASLLSPGLAWYRYGILRK